MLGIFLFIIIEGAIYSFIITMKKKSYEAKKKAKKNINMDNITKNIKNSENINNINYPKEKIVYNFQGQRIKSEKSKENFYKFVLKNVGIINEKKEINCIIVDNVELKFLVKIINKYKRKKSKTLYKKGEKEETKRVRGFSQPQSSQPGMSIQDKIKFYKKKIQN